MADGRAGCGGDVVVEVGSDGWKGEGAGDGWRVGRLKSGGSFVAGRSQFHCRCVGGWSWGVVVGVLGYTYIYIYKGGYMLIPLIKAYSI